MFLFWSDTNGLNLQLNETCGDGVMDPINMRSRV